jgi:hypothetical protein
MDIFFCIDILIANQKYLRGDQNKLQIGKEKSGLNSENKIRETI